MPRKRFSAAEGANRLREAEVLIAQGQSVAQVCKQIGIAHQTYYRRRARRATPSRLRAGGFHPVAGRVGQARRRRGCTDLQRRGVVAGHHADRLLAGLQVGGPAQRGPWPRSGQAR